MFVLKSTAKALLHAEQKIQDTMRIAHLAEINSLHGQIFILKDQISRLDKLVFPEVSSKDVPKDVLEADSVLSGSQKPAEISDEEHNRMLDGDREFNLILSDNYSEDLI